LLRILPNSDHGPLCTSRFPLPNLQPPRTGIIALLEWLTALPWVPPPPGSDALARSDFLSNAKSQLDADHFGLDKVKRRLFEHLAVVRLRALIAQEAEMEQTKVQEVTLEKAIEGPSAGDGQKEKELRALVKSGDHSITNVRRSTRGPQSDQNHQSPDFAVRNSFCSYYRSKT